MVTNDHEMTVVGFVMTEAMTVIGILIVILTMILMMILVVILGVIPIVSLSVSPMIDVSAYLQFCCNYECN